MSLSKFRLRHSLKKLIYLNCARLSHWIKPAKELHHELLVLMYHKVNNIPDNPLTVNITDFEQQMQILSQDYRVLSLSELEQLHHKQKPLPPKAVLLTFDDGYLDNLTYAYPILKKYQLPATLFIPTGLIGRQTLPHDEHLPFACPTLTWDELSKMRDVFSIQPHTVHHKVLSRLSDQDAWQEIYQSAKTVEQYWEASRAFSYPKGSPEDFGPRDHAYVAQVAPFAFTTETARSAWPLKDPHLIPRYNVEDFGLEYFHYILSGHVDWIRWKDSSWGIKLKNFGRRLLGITNS